MTSIRWARAEDAADLADVHIETWQVAYEGILPGPFLLGLDRERRRAWWRRTLGEGARVHVAGDDGVIGFCHAGASHDAGWGEVFAIYVHPSHWGTGVGRDLLGAAEEQLRDDGFERALLWVLEQNVRGCRFYERQGWTRGKPVRIEEIGGAQVTELRYETYL